MATTLPGSPYVESSDLVANYPAVSEALAERVDLVGVLPFADAAARTTALPTPTDGQYSYLQDTNSTEYWNGSAWVAAGVAPGLVHINTTAFSAVSSVSLNSVFSSSYDNYRILCNFTGSTDGGGLFRMRASGTDTSTGYRNNLLYNGPANSAGGLYQASATNFYIFNHRNGIDLSYSLDLFNPFLTKRTLAQSHFTDSLEMYLSGNKLENTTSYDGFSMIPASGTITGTIRVFGYKNS